ncbi:MAG: guanylate kinase, partial [Pseudomonadota bacterium]
MSSPSGAGKTTLARRLLQHDPSLSMSVSLTTRPMREGERDGHDYHFVDAAGFAAARDAGELLEWAEVFGNFYGTPRGPVMAQLEAGRDMLFDVDWQGAQQMAERAPEDLVRVFILPPSVASLEERLRKRNQDPAEVVQARMAKAMDEIAHWHEYDYVIVNEELDVSLQGLSA